MANYYFSQSTGNDTTGDGTQALPWQTLSKASGLTLVAGDYIYLMRGDTWTDEILQNFESGVSGNPITVTAYGTGAKPLISPTSANGGIYIYDDDFIVIDNIQFSGGASGTARHFWIRTCHDVTVQNCDFTGTTPNFSIQITSNDDTQDTYNIIIDNCTFTDCAAVEAIRFQPGSLISQIRDCTIQNCTFTRIGSTGASAQGTAIRWLITQAQIDAGIPPLSGMLFTRNTITNCIWAFMGAYLQDSTISYNVCSEIGDPLKDNVNAFQLNYIDNLIIEHNTITNVYTSAPDGAGIIIDWNNSDDAYASTNCIVRNNKISGCRAMDSGKAIACYKSINGQYYNNIIYDSSYGITISSSISTGNVFYNNTIYDCDDGFRLGGLQGVVPLQTIYNNIISTCDDGMHITNSATEPTEDYNCFFNNTTYNIRNYTTGQTVALGANSITTDPLLDTTTYKIPTNSPCKDAGINLFQVQKDYFGNQRPIGASTDIGVHEYWNTELRNCVIRNAVLV